MSATTRKGIEINNPRLHESFEEIQRLAALGTLTAGVAHELTNPINVITATCNNVINQLLDGSLDADDLQHYIEIIDQSAWRCARLIRTLRDYSYMNGRLFAHCDLNQIVQTALTLVGYEFEREHNIKLITDLEDPLQLIECDQNQITQVLINLLLNSRDAIPLEGGTIRIKTRDLPDEGAQMVSVIDSGGGIDPSIFDTMFEPFVTTKELGSGTGLGLAISAKIVQEHQGRLLAENNPDQGATFTMILPLNQ